MLSFLHLMLLLHILHIDVEFFHENEKYIVKYRFGKIISYKMAFLEDNTVETSKFVETNTNRN